MAKLTKRAIEDSVIEQALQILEKRLKAPGVTMGVPDVVVNYLRLSLGMLEHEVFGVLFLDIRNRLIKDERLFRGTIAHTSVYPREILKLGLKYNASAVILYHNHPSGICDPTGDDNRLTRTLKEILSKVDIRLLDHIIVGHTEQFSYAEKGLI